MGKIDFDAQRAEAGVEVHEITVAGRDIKLQPVVSLESALSTDQDDPSSILKAIDELVVDPDDAPHLRQNLSIDELNQVMEELYGMTDEEGDPAPNREARRARAKTKPKAAKG